jgi:putative flippase GtrA
MTEMAHARALATRRLPVRRLLKFGAVGAVCLLIQLAIMQLLVRLGVSATTANAAGFVSSAQCKFALSYTYVWGDRRARRPTIRGLGRQLGLFNAVVLLGAVLNTAAFAAATQLLRLPLTMAAVAAILLTAGITFALQHLGVFRRGGAEELVHESPERLREFARDGVAWFLPAHNEARNLPLVVDDTLFALGTLGVPHRLIIVNDGSSDGTRDVAERLQAAHPAVSVVHHKRNQGYGAALRTGFAAAYDTGCGLVGFCDADHQFRVSQDIRMLLTRMQHSEADLVIGYRRHRADPLVRKLMGSGWHLASKWLLRFRANDVDCGFKLFRRHVLGSTVRHLYADHAAISPQLLALSTRLDFKIEEAAVNHYPRPNGKQSGANLKVILGSFRSLFQIRSSATEAAIAEGVMKPKWWRRIDPMARIVAVVGATLSIAAYAYFSNKGMTLSYKDSISHLLIARRVTDSPTPGLAQLGGVWPPLPHLLMLPLTWVDTAYYSGLAGSLASMLAYVVCAVLVYRIGRSLTDQRSAGVVAALVFMLNPNVLYMQSTPMTELLMLAATAGAVYGLLRWIQTQNYLYLAAGAGAASLGTLTRYEGWVLLLALVAVILYAAIRHRFGWAKLQGLMIAFLTLAASGIVAWMAWNQLILGDFLAFQRGEYAKPSLWVGAEELAIHNLPVALDAYWIATFSNVTVVMTVLGLAGLAVYLYCTRLAAESMPVLALLVFFPFFVAAQYLGQRPLHVLQIHHALYNVRFGLVMVLPASIFVGYLAAWLGQALRRHRLRLAPAALASLAAVAVAVAAVQTDDIITLREPVAERSNRWSARADAASTFLRDHYRGGLVLMESFGNEQVVFESRIPSRNHIYEGSYRLWEPALERPRASGIAWIFMRRSEGTEDRVFRALNNSPQLRHYRLVYRDIDRLIYASPSAVTTESEHTQ